MKHTQLVFNFYELEEGDHPELTSTASVEVQRQGQRAAYLETDTALIAAAFGDDIANLATLKVELEAEKTAHAETKAAKDIRISELETALATALEAL